MKRRQKVSPQQHDAFELFNRDREPEASTAVQQFDAASKRKPKRIVARGEWYQEWRRVWSLTAEEKHEEMWEFLEEWFASDKTKTG